MMAAAALFTCVLLFGCQIWEVSGRNQFWLHIYIYVGQIFRNSYLWSHVYLWFPCLFLCTYLHVASYICIYEWLLDWVLHHGKKWHIISLTVHWSFLYEILGAWYFHSFPPAFHLYFRVKPAASTLLSWAWIISFTVSLLMCLVI
jgi:hypothetical protein